MKTLLAILVLITYFVFPGSGQVPQGFNYQAVIRDSNGEILSNQSATLQFTIRSLTPNGAIDYREQQILITNEFGLVNCVIGNGTIINGTMSTPNWGFVNQYLQVEVNTGLGFVDMGTQQLMSVPHSFVSDFALGADLSLDEINDVSLGTVANKNILFYDTDHWEAGTAYEAFTMGSGILINGNTISNTGDTNSLDDANISLSNLLNTSINSDLNPEPDNSFLSLGTNTRRWWFLYLSGALRMSYGSSIRMNTVDLFIDCPENEYDSNMSFGLNAGTPDTGYDNTLFGYYSGENLSSGNFNSCFGSNSGEALSTGLNNSMFGTNAGSDLATGDQNAYFGANTGSYGTNVNNNTYIGFRAGRDNTTGSNNVLVGCEAGVGGQGENNTALGAFSSPGGGGGNVLVGYSAGTSSANAAENTYIGMNSGGGIGSNNVCVGFDAGGNQTTGDQNTFLGYSAEGSLTNLDNACAIGYQASVTASNRVRIGNGSVTQIGGQVGWSTLSDARLKQNIQSSTLGLSFIQQLKPVTYNYIEGNTEIRYTGFLAQDVEKTLNEMGEEFSGITAPENETDYYSIRYAEFVVPLVNGMQEQQKQIEELKLMIVDQQKQIQVLLQSQISK